MATGIGPLSFSGGARVDTLQVRSLKSNSFVKTSSLGIPSKVNHRGAKNKLTVFAEYSDERGSGGGDFVAGFLLGGAIFGTIAYVFAPQIRRSLLNEDESGFRKAKRPVYYDEGLEKTRQTLNDKISQLNSAIDNVSSRLRGSNNKPQVPLEPDQEEAAMEEML